MEARRSFPWCQLEKGCVYACMSVCVCVCGLGSAWIGFPQMFGTALSAHANGPSFSIHQLYWITFILQSFFEQRCILSVPRNNNGSKGSQEKRVPDPRL